MPLVTHAADWLDTWTHGIIIDLLAFFWKIQNAKRNHYPPLPLPILLPDTKEGILTNTINVVQGALKLA